MMLPSIIQYGVYPKYEEATGKGLSQYVKKYKKYVLALKTSEGLRYCSSSTINYKGTIYTVTNNHCCDYGNGMLGQDEIRVGDYIEKIVHQSKIADVCVLTSKLKESPITLAKKEFDILDEVLLMGYPRGSFLTPRYGHVLRLSEEVCIPYISGIACVDSNYTSTISFGGNSGSPIFNSNGELVNVLYAGSTFLHTYSITVPYFFVRAALEEAHRNGKNQ